MYRKQVIAGMVMLFILGVYPKTDIYPKMGLATWYTAEFTSAGEMFKDDDLTCAMRQEQYGKFFTVCNISNNKCVKVRQNDFGPAKELFEEGRIIDLSKGAFSRIAALEEGVIEVRIEPER